MDRKILRLALVIAVSLFVGTVFTGCNDGEDASEPYLLKKEDVYKRQVYDQLYMEYKLPEGINSTRVARDLEEIEAYLKKRCV